MPRLAWTRDETLVAFNLYCRTPFGKLHARNPEIVEVAAALGRTAGALSMKCANLAAFDEALQARGIKGLSKASRLDAEIWEEFTAQPEEIAFQSEQVFAQVMQREVRAEREVRWEDVRGLDRLATTKVRVNQYLFRSIVLAGYRNGCAVCALPFPKLLVASHIVPWSIDKSCRMNPHNGICLCTLHDRAFDHGLLLIRPDYTLAPSDTIRQSPKMASIHDLFLRFDNQSLILPDRWHPDPTLLQRHSDLLAAAPT